MNTNEKTQAQAAATWWAKQIEAPKFDNGDDSNAGGMAMALALMSSPLREGSELEAFERELTKIIESEKPRIIDVDYHPDATLAKAAELAGMKNYDMSTFPWKTMMWLRDDGSISVRSGYGANGETIRGADVTTEA